MLETFQNSKVPGKKKEKIALSLKTGDQSLLLMWMLN